MEKLFHSPVKEQLIRFHQSFHEICDVTLVRLTFPLLTCEGSTSQFSRLSSLNCVWPHQKFNSPKTHIIHCSQIGNLLLVFSLSSINSHLNLSDHSKAYANSSMNRKRGECGERFYTLHRVGSGSWWRTKILSTCNNLVSWYSVKWWLLFNSPNCFEFPLLTCVAFQDEINPL